MPTIRVDEDVYKWLQSLATPFEDNPNSVLRKVASLDINSAEQSVIDPSRDGNDMRTTNDYGNLRVTAKMLMRKWDVHVEHGLYHRDGNFYENIRRFPGALFDPHGYVIFNTEDEYRRSPYLRISQKLNVRNGISSIPGYIQKE